MRAFITGGTGFIGRALVSQLTIAGVSVTVLARNVPAARARLGPSVQLVPTNVSESDLANALSAADYVINLAGEPLLGGRWTRGKKNALRESRLDLTARLIQALGRAEPRPSVLISASAVGFYGDRGNETLSEESSAGSDFLSQLCRDWETEAERAGGMGIRVVTIRIGVVLGTGGGALSKMLPAFRLGLGGPVGSGRQFVPWIHLKDLVNLIEAGTADERFRGPVNGTAPVPVPFRRFAASIGRGLKRPSLLRIPSFVVRVLFGEASVVLLTSQRAVPRKAQALGFEFQFGTIDDAVDHLLASN